MNINVRHSDFEESISVIDGYVDNIEKYMKKSTEDVRSLTRTNWKSTDGSKFYNKWLKQNDKDSVTEHMKAELREYTKVLNYAEEQYKNAQAKAYDLANSCKGIF